MNKKIALLSLALCTAAQPVQADAGDWFKNLMIAGATAAGVGAVGYGIYCYASEADQRALRSGDNCCRNAHQLARKVRGKYSDLVVAHPHRTQRLIEQEINKRNKRFPTLSYYNDVDYNIKSLEQTERSIDSHLRDLNYRISKASAKRDDDMAQEFAFEARNLCDRLRTTRHHISALIPELVVLKNTVRKLPAYDKETQQKHIENLERQAREQQQQIERLRQEQNRIQFERTMEKLSHVFCTADHCSHCHCNGHSHACAHRHCSVFVW